MNLFLIQSLLSVTWIMLLLSMSFGPVSHEHHAKDMKSDDERHKDSVISAMNVGGKFTFQKNRTWEMSRIIRSLIYIMQKLLSVPEASGSHTENQSAILGKLQLGIPLVWQRHILASPCLWGTIFSFLSMFSAGFILSSPDHVTSAPELTQSKGEVGIGPYSLSTSQDLDQFTPVLKPQIHRRAQKIFYSSVQQSKSQDNNSGSRNQVFGNK